MSRELSNPLQSLLAGAAKSLPAATGETAHFRARLDGAGTGVVILADVSSSMEERAGARAKIDLLREALDALWPELAGARLIVFGSTARRVASPAELPAPSGGTALHLALAEASGNQVITATMAGLRSGIEAYAFAGLANIDDWAATSARLRHEHRGIVEAIERADAATARTRVRPSDSLSSSNTQR